MLTQLKEDLCLDSELTPKQVIEKLSADYEIDTSSGTTKDKLKKLAAEFDIETGW